MDIFEFKDYRKFVVKWVSSQPKGGRGVFSKMAQQTGISSVYISQVFKGDRQLSLDQAFRVAQFMGLLQKERRFFLLLVQWDRASDFRYKEELEKEIEEQVQKSYNLKNRLNTKTQLSQEAQSTFYSHWGYAAIRILSSIPQYQTFQSLSEKLKLPLEQTQKMTEFLIQQGLCVQKGDSICIGPQSQHLPSDSPFITQRHQSWRLKAMETLSQKNKDHFFFSAPMSLSLADKQKIKKKLIHLVDELYKIIPESQPEDLACINIDWFDF